MKKQYIAEYQHNTYRQGEWVVATDPNRIGGRYHATLEKAQEALDHVVNYFNGKPRTTTQVCGMIGITSHTDSKTAKSMMVVKTRIRVREVTPWETVEEVDV